MKYLLVLLSLITYFQVGYTAEDCSRNCEATNKVNLPHIDESNLKDILLAASSSYSGDEFYGIKGRDNREIITNPRTNRQISGIQVGRLDIVLNERGSDKQESICSATLVGKKFLLTAAHCFYNFHEGRFEASRAYFYLHASKNDSSLGGHKVEKVYLTKDLVDEESAMELGIPKRLVGQDFALLELSEELGNQINPLTESEEGWNHFGNYSYLNNDVPVRTAGYPGDKDGDLTLERCQANADSKAADRYKIDCDVFPGQSGSSLIAKVERNGKTVNRVIGVISAASGGKTNYAVRLTDETFKIITDWYQGRDNPNTHIIHLQ